MEGGKANRYAALQGGGGGVKVLSKSALRKRLNLPFLIYLFLVMIGIYLTEQY